MALIIVAVAFGVGSIALAHLIHDVVVLGHKSGGSGRGNKELVADEAVDLAVQDDEERLVDVGGETVPGSGERVADGRAQHRVEIDLGEVRQRL